MRDLSIRRLFIATFLLALGAGSVAAQQLALRRYDASDGLATGEVTSIYQDRKGYIWLTTFEGVSRFDGYSFVNYGVRDGLPHLIVNHVAEDREGRLWVATNGGVARLVEGGGADGERFTRHPIGDLPDSNKVNRMLFDSRGNLWCLTDFGLYRARADEAALQFEPVASRESGDSAAALEDRQGRLWFGVKNELIEVGGAGIIRHAAASDAGDQRIRGITEDKQGRLLVGLPHALFTFTPPHEPGQRGGWQRVPLALKPDQTILTMFQDREGTLWLGTMTGLTKYQDGRQTEYAAAQGLEMSPIRAMTEDLDGNLWLGSAAGGVYKLASEGTVNYTRAQGLPPSHVNFLFSDRAGQIHALLSNQEVVTISGDRITRARRPDPPFGDHAWRFDVDRAGRVQGVIMPLRPWGEMKPVIGLSDGRKVNIADLIPPKDWNTGVLTYEDERGMLWLITDVGKIYRADPARQRHLEGFAVDITPAKNQTLVVSDGAWGLWISKPDQLWRLRQGRISEVRPGEGLPEINPRCLFRDSRGWLWIGMRFTGVSMTKEPGAEQPVFVNYSSAGGLASDAVGAMTEDDSGRIYFATSRGLTRFDPSTGEWRTYTINDGLPSDRMGHLYRDREGNIWAATLMGVSKLDPRAERSAGPAAPIYLSRVQVAGEDLLFTERGIGSMPRVELSPARNNLLIEFVGLSFHGEDNLLYQYRLEGVDDDWSAPTKTRFVNYARLAPGAYRFLARAINRDGVVSPHPAVFEFVILRPVWQRWWFLALASLLIGVAAYALYRYRVGRLLELERIRTRIAADLHDDIGANLTRISILSEVANAQFRPPPTAADDPLQAIARISRESISSMSDIVWAINPRKDNLSELVGRMRRLAEDVLPARGIECEFHAPGLESNIRLGTEIRRDLFLIFKEALNNAVRHSGCRRVEIDLSSERGKLALRMRDDGRGFDMGREGDGQGLENMRRRAAALGGEFHITSVRGAGTTVTVTVPPRR